MNDRERLEAIIKVVRQYLPPDGIYGKEAMGKIIELVDPLPPKREWVGLTEEEIFQAYKPEMEGMPFNKPTLAVIAGYLEAKLKEKNT